MEDPNDVSVREYVEALLREHDKAHEQLALATRVALAAQDKRLDAMNEFRESLNDVTSRAVSRELFDQRVTATSERLGALERAQATVVTDATFDARYDQTDQRLKILENYRSRAAGAAVVLTVLAGSLGALIIWAITH